jgi:hypothetical protein
MSMCRHSMESGLNAFLKEQAKQLGLLDLALAQFDTEYDVVWEPVRVKKNTAQYSLQPRGCTGLLDAVGYENSSTDWTKERVKALVEQQATTHGSFLYLSANMDAIAEVPVVAG